VIAAWPRLRHGSSTSGQVERLINLESIRSLGISRAEAADLAIERYRRDNR
jgi:hypothetical protein